MTCKACKARGQTWSGSAPVCAFDGEFSDNWNCATVNAIRDIVYEGGPPRTGVDYQYCDDQKYATVKVDEVEFDEGRYLALWVSWYKNRGGTDAMWLLSKKGPPRRPTEDELLAICDYYRVPVEGLSNG